MWRIRTAASRRVLWGGGVLLAAMLLVVFAHVPILRALGSFLIIEDPLRPAAAIVALGGDPPFREMEAARLYRAGWAPRVVIVRGARREESKPLQEIPYAPDSSHLASRDRRSLAGNCPSVESGPLRPVALVARATERSN